MADWPAFAPVFHLIAEMTLLTWMEWIATSFSLSTLRVNMPQGWSSGRSHSFQVTTNLTLPEVFLWDRGSWLLGR